MAGLNVKGLAWPFRFGPRGHANRISKVPRIKQNLVSLTLTKRGERIREREIGTIAHEAAFRNISEPRLTLISDLVYENLTIFEPRTLLSPVTWVRRDGYDGYGVYLDIPFEIRGDSALGGVAEAKIGE